MLPTEPQKEGLADGTRGQAGSWGTDGCRTVTSYSAVHQVDFVKAIGDFARARPTSGSGGKGISGGLRASPGSSRKPVEIALPVLPVDFADPIRVQECFLQRVPYQLLGLVKPEVPCLRHLFKAHAMHNFATAGVGTYEGACMNPLIEKPG